MELSISYREAVKRYPTQVTEIIKSLRASKCKNKNASPDKLKWSLYWCVRVDGMNATQFMDSVMNPQTPKTLTEDETIADYEQRSHVTLHASRYQSSQISKLPLEIEKLVRDDYKAAKADKEHFDGLSPEERDAEVQELLKKLRGSSGFMEIHIQKKLGDFK